MSGLVKSTRAMLYTALLGMLVQAAVPALQALHASQHASEHAIADATAVATLDDLSLDAYRSGAPANPHDDDGSGPTCKVCKGHARLGSVLPTARLQTPDTIASASAPSAPDDRAPGLVSRLGSRPRAPPPLVS